MLTEVLAEVRLALVSELSTATFFVTAGFLFSLETFSIVCRTTGVSCLALLWAVGVALDMEAFCFTSGAFFLDEVLCFFKGLAITLLPARVDGVFCLEDLFVVGISKDRKNVFQSFIPYLFANCNWAGGEGYKGRF